MNKKHFFSYLFLSVAGLCVIGSLFLVSRTFGAQALSPNNAAGWSWSANIGWLRANNCSQIDVPVDPSKCPGAGYGVNVLRPTPAAHGLMSGYAWSSNLGWISFEPESLDPAPSGYSPSQAYVDWTANGGNGPYPVKGWARACSVFAAGCSGSLRDPLYLGGWDGLIALSDTKGNDAHTWNLSVSADGKTMTGFGWGSNVIGWVDMKMNVTRINYQCSDGVDNDGDIDIDYREGSDGTLIGDPGCFSPTDDDESDDDSFDRPVVDFFGYQCAALGGNPKLAWGTTDADQCRIVSRGTTESPGGTSQTAVDNSINSRTVNGSQNIGGLYYYTSTIPMNNSSGSVYTLECINSLGTTTAVTNPSPVMSCATIDDFSIVAQPRRKSLSNGGGSDTDKQIATFIISASARDGFTDPITLSVDAWPSNIPNTKTGTFSSNTLTYNATTGQYNTSTLTVKIPQADVSVGSTYTGITVAGKSGSQKKTTTVDISVTIKPIYIEH